MKYVVVLEVDDSVMEGADSIEHVCLEVNEQNVGNGVDWFSVRPLSEVIAC